VLCSVPSQPLESINDRWLCEDDSRLENERGEELAAHELVPVGRDVGVEAGEDVAVQVWEAIFDNVG
jgi:hypothetical protein